MTTNTTTEATTTQRARQDTAHIKASFTAHFPGIKVSVRRSRGTGWGWVDVTWTDGPQWSTVEEAMRGVRAECWHVRDISYTRTYSDAAQGHALALTTRPNVHPWDAAVAARRILDQLDLTGTTL